MIVLKSYMRLSLVQLPDKKFCVKKKGFVYFRGSWPKYYELKLNVEKKLHAKLVDNFTVTEDYNLALHVYNKCKARMGIAI